MDRTCHPPPGRKLAVDSSSYVSGLETSLREPPQQLAGDGCGGPGSIHKGELVKVTTELAECAEPSERPFNYSAVGEQAEPVCGACFTISSRHPQANSHGVSTSPV
jgi:hypothetical protein